MWNETSRKIQNNRKVMNFCGINQTVTEIFGFMWKIVYIISIYVQFHEILD